MSLSWRRTYRRTCRRRAARPQRACDQTRTGWPRRRSARKPRRHAPPAPAVRCTAPRCRPRRSRSCTACSRLICAQRRPRPRPHRGPHTAPSLEGVLIRQQQHRSRITHPLIEQLGREDREPRPRNAAGFTVALDAHRLGGVDNLRRDRAARAAAPSLNGNTRRGWLRRRTLASITSPMARCSLWMMRSGYCRTGHRDASSSSALAEPSVASICASPPAAQREQQQPQT
eukprot:scaffold831_cov336-Prasinococcus_capsulatus_cf.AAC.10